MALSYFVVLVPTISQIAKGLSRECELTGLGFSYGSSRRMMRRFEPILVQVPTRTDVTLETSTTAEFDKCVVCGILTEYHVSDVVAKRRGYIEGAGQLCSGCARKLA